MDEYRNNSGTFEEIEREQYRRYMAECRGNPVRLMVWAVLAGALLALVLPVVVR